MPPRITQESCRPRVSDRTMVGTVPSGSCLQSVRAEPQPTIMKPTATSSGSTARCLQGRQASFWRHGEIYRKGRRPSLGQASTRPSAQPFDEFPVGYSWASCSPAEPASASPTVFHFAVNGQSRRDCVAHTSSPPQTGLDAQKTSRCPAREKCFSLTSPFIDPAATEAGLTLVTTGAFCALPAWHTPITTTSKARESPLAVRRDLQFMEPPVVTNRCYEPWTGRSRVEAPVWAVLKWVHT